MAAVREEILALIHRYGNRIRGLSAELDEASAGQRVAYRIVLEDLKRIWELFQEEEER